jgi:lipoate-protein ligase A
MSPLPLDEDLLESVCADPGAGPLLRVWQPSRVAVVLGRSNRPERELHLDACRADGVPVQRRAGGGGAVVLGPGCVVVSLARRVARPTALGEHMAFAVEAIAAEVRRLGGPGLEARGHGDLCAGQRKVLGSSAFRRRDVFFYQGSLLVAMDLGLVERYLRHPSREPAYRRGRPHRSFLTTLAAQGLPLGAAAVAGALGVSLGERLGSPGAAGPAPPPRRSGPA